MRIFVYFVRKCRETKMIQTVLGREKAQPIKGFKNTCKIIAQGWFSLLPGVRRGLAGEVSIWEGVLAEG